MLGGAIKKLISGDFSGAWKDAKSSVNDFSKNYDASIKRFNDGTKELTKVEKEEAEKRAENRRKAEEKRLAEEQKAKEKVLADRKAELDKINALEEEFTLKAVDTDKIKKDTANASMISDLETKVAIGQNYVAEQRNMSAQEIADAQAVADAKKSIQESTFNNISSGIGLLKGLFEKNKGLQKALLIAESAAGIAKIIINTRAANAAAKLKYALLPGGVALAAAEATMNNVSAGIGIATTIAATAKGLSAFGGGSAPSSGGVGGEGGGAAPAAPSFNVVGASSTNQLAQTIGNQQQQPIKAYVVSNDVTTAQSLDRNIIQSASIG
jgi:hypothetical protein